MAESHDNLPGRGFLGWLGRQIGHVTKAVKTDVTAPPPPSPPQTPRVLYRTDTVEQVPHPTEPGIVLRRTTVDEVVVTETPPPGPR